MYLPLWALQRSPPQRLLSVALNPQKSSQSVLSAPGPPRAFLSFPRLPRMPTPSGAACGSGRRLLLKAVVQRMQPLPRRGQPRSLSFTLWPETARTLLMRRSASHAKVSLPTGISQICSGFISHRGKRSTLVLWSFRVPRVVLTSQPGSWLRFPLKALSCGCKSPREAGPGGRADLAGQGDLACRLLRFSLSTQGIFPRRNGELHFSLLLCLKSTPPLLSPPIANRSLLALIPPFAEMRRHVCVYHVQGALSLVSSDDEVMGDGGCQVKAKEIVFR